VRDDADNLGYIEETIQRIANSTKMESTRFYERRPASGPRG